MLIQFSINNFKAFKDQALLSMVASNYDTTTREAENVLYDRASKQRLLKSAAVFGANGSGKTSLFEALDWLRIFVLHNTSSLPPDEKIPVKPYNRIAHSGQSGTAFELVVSIAQTQYRYGVEVNEHQVIAEWLYVKPKTKEVELFYRDGMGIVCHDRLFPKGKALAKEGLVKANVLLLSLAAHFNDSNAQNMMTWFHELTIVSNNTLSLQSTWVREKLMDFEFGQRIAGLLRAADLDFVDCVLPPSFQGKSHISIHSHISKKSYAVSEPDAEYGLKMMAAQNQFEPELRTNSQWLISLEKEASSGTQKYCALCAYLLHALDKGVPIVVDALDSNLHAHLVAQIVEWFNSRDFNSNHAQLIFNTMDAHLLSTGLMRRDQVWFAEKDRYGASKLYSLADFKSEDVRKNESFEENYLRGKYGAIPILAPVSINIIKNKKDEPKRKKSL